MIKREEKGIAIAMVLASAAATIYCGLIGWRVYLVPLQYVGYALAVVGLAGLAGANVWVGPFKIRPDDGDNVPRDLNP